MLELVDPSANMSYEDESCNAYCTYRIERFASTLLLQGKDCYFLVKHQSDIVLSMLDGGSCGNRWMVARQPAKRPCGNLQLMPLVATAFSDATSCCALCFCMIWSQLFMMLYSATISSVHLFYLIVASGCDQRGAWLGENRRGARGRVSFFIWFWPRILESFSLLGFVQFSSL